MTERSYWGTKSTRYPPPRDGIPIPEELRPLISPNVTPRVRSAESLVTATEAQHLADEEAPTQQQKRGQEQQAFAAWPSNAEADVKVDNSGEKEHVGLLFDIPPPPAANVSFLLG